MDINSWEDTWGTIDWKKDSENKIKQKITEFYHAGVDFNMGRGRNGGPLCFAASYSTAGVIDLLIDGGADINLTDEYGRIPLHWAAYGGKIENVECLIEHGPTTKNYINKQDKCDETALMRAIEKGHTEIVQVLIEHGADVNLRDDGYLTALDYAAERGYTETVKTLIEAGADINVKNNIGNTPLHDAAARGYTKTVKTLVEAGADVNVKDNIGNTALHYAAGCFMEMVKVLIEHGADVNIQNDCCDTALRFSRNAEIVRALIKAGANMDIKGTDGRTVLHYMAKDGRKKEVQALIEAGANVNIKDDDGRTALDLSKDKEIKKLIQNADKIRADYLKNKTKASLYNTLDNASEKPNKLAWLKKLIKIR